MFFKLVFAPDLVNFAKEKQECLSKQDKSKKGSIDARIRSLVDAINSFEQYYTTSTCSGRIVVISRDPSGKKNKADWLLASHEQVDPCTLKTALENLPETDVWFRAEPAIIHIAAQSLEAALKLLEIGRTTGFKRGGIISSTAARTVLELISTEVIDAPIAESGQLIVPSTYLETLREKANIKLETTWSKIDRFQFLLDKIV